jgi:hypothetical protein
VDIFFRIGFELLKAVGAAETIGGSVIPKAGRGISLTHPHAAYGIKLSWSFRFVTNIIMLHDFFLAECRSIQSGIFSVRARTRGSRFKISTSSFYFCYFEPEARSLSYKMRLFMQVRRKKSP